MGGPQLTDTVLTVRQRRLDEMLEEVRAPEQFDLLSVDVEGYESEVFGGFDLERWMPGLMIVELADLHPDLTTTRAKDAELSRRDPIPWIRDHL